MTCRQKRQITRIFPRDSGDFPPRFRGVFPGILQGENDKMCSLFSCSGCDENGAHCYSGPLRCPDEVLDPLRRPDAYGIEGSFSAGGGGQCSVSDKLNLRGIKPWKFSADDGQRPLGGPPSAGLAMKTRMADIPAARILVAPIL